MSGRTRWLMAGMACAAGWLFLGGSVASGQELPEACCLGDGCQMLPPSYCLTLGGVSQGSGSTCNEPGICMQACCLDGLCFGIWPAGVCVAHGGTPQGAGSNCVSGTPCRQGGCTSDLDCDDGDLCTLDFCDAATKTCVHVPNPDCVACCLPDGTCQNMLPGLCLEKQGTPQGPGTVCGPGFVCDHGCTPNEQCDDGNACTEDFCKDGVCYHLDIVCYDGNPCTNDYCDPATGACKFEPVNCEDNNPCTKDYCSEATGGCVHEPINCDDGDPCTDDFCDPASPTLCVHIPRNCDDGNACTNDYCDPVTGQCVHEPANCDDGDLCTIDSCDPQSGQCIHVPNPDCQACCLPDGSCQNLPPAVCKDRNGILQGPGSDCSSGTSCHQEGVPKFSQPPTPEREDIPSNLWISPNGIQQPNVDVADDFRSDGRPISSVRWWGSYLNDEYVPKEFGGFDQPPYQIDGWLISFHLPVVMKQVAGANPKRPALGLYFAPREAVKVNLTGIIPCDGHKVFEYIVDLNQCCLIQSNPDPRLPATVPDRCPAQPASFNEHHCYWYALNIQAVVGVKWLGGTGALCCERVFTNNIALGDFWGWHAMSIEKGVRPAVRTALSLGEPVQSPCPPLNQCPPGPRPLYGPWSYVKPVCPFDHRINMAFELLTPVTQVPDPCKPLHLIGATSLKSHGSAGEFGIDLPLAPPYGVEGRVDGPTKIVLTFDQDIVAGDGSVDIADEVATSDGVIDSLTVAGNTITLLMHGVPNASCVTLSVANGADGITTEGGEPLEGPNQVRVVVLLGDVNADRAVNVLDLITVRNLQNQAATPAVFPSDVDATGHVNVLDLITVRNLMNTKAGCP